MTLSLDLGVQFQSKKLPADAQKLRGGYYTPDKLARYLSDWAIRDGRERILEPSSGDGNFLVATLESLNARFPKRRAAEIVSVELEAGEERKARARTRALAANQQISWHSGDFFHLFDRLRCEERFDVVLGNPPFIRFQYFDAESREIAFAHLRQAGYRPTKLANAWAAFIQLSIELLNDGGRLAMVVPAELLQVGYAAELRQRLSEKFAHIVIVGFRRLVFPEIQQEIVLLLAEGKRDRGTANSDIHTVEFNDGEDLLATNHLRDAVSHMPARHTRRGMKWTALFLGDSEYAALDEAERSDKAIPLGTFADVDIGIVTGRNGFFVLTDELRQQLRADPYVLQIVGRTSALKSIRFTAHDFEEHQNEKPSYLLDLTGHAEATLPAPLREYLRRGEREEIHLGYKCRIRRRWYDVPSIYVPDAFLFRQIHMYPLLVANEAHATSTDTVHRVRFRQQVDAKLLCACFFNSLTLAWSEVAGRSYGGGVLELEPREAEELPIPFAPDLDLDPARVDGFLRKGKPEAALDYVDGIVLRRHMGLSAATVRGLRSAWETLRDRRKNRR
jgi:adenine-specific DNA-methyltransferase